MRNFAKELGVPTGLILTDPENLPPPFFYDVTLRDGNQALKHPWNPSQKKIIFGFLQQLGVPAVEVGYPGASPVDFDCVTELIGQAPAGMVVGALARTHPKDIRRAIDALAFARGATPLLHTFIGMSPFHLETVLHLPPDEVRKIAVASVREAKKGVGPKGQVEFSPEHFGDCIENLDWVIDCFREIIEAGADIINLPNTVERYRPGVFVPMARKVRAALPDHVRVSVHAHNDLGMGTATTVESYFAGVQQLEVTLNGLGERAGNSNLYEVATALYCNGVDPNLEMGLIYEIALKVALLAQTAIPEKAPLIGAGCFMQRSGVHQHGAVQTFERAKGAYRPIPPAWIGRAGDEELEFTSQSGYTAAYKIIMETGRAITKEEARLLQPALKLVSEDRGALKPEELACAYDAFKKLSEQKPGLTQDDVNAVVRDAIGIQGERAWEYKQVTVTAGTSAPTATVILVNNGIELPPQAAIGDGPVDATFKAIGNITGLAVRVEKYNIGNITGGADSQGEVITVLSLDGRQCGGHGIDTDIVIASVKAYLNALNRLLRGETNGVLTPTVL